MTERDRPLDVVEARAVEASAPRRSPSGLAPAKRARAEGRLAAILTRVANGDDVAAATEHVYLHSEFSPYSRPPAVERSRTYWLGAYGKLLREVAPDVLETAKQTALGRLAGDAEAALAALGKLVRGTFPRATREDIGAAREQREAAQFVVEALGAGTKRFVGSHTNALQVNVNGGAGHIAAQDSANRILAELEAYHFARGVAFARGEPEPPRPRGHVVHRIEDGVADEPGRPARSGWAEDAVLDVRRAEGAPAASATTDAAQADAEHLDDVALDPRADGAAPDAESGAATDDGEAQS